MSEFVALPGAISIFSKTRSGDGRELLAGTEANDINNHNGSYETYPGDSKGPSSKKIRQALHQSDQALINCVLEDTNHTTYFTSPPLHEIVSSLVMIHASLN